MFTYLRKVATTINNQAGLSIQRTFLYSASKPDGWKAAFANDNGLRWEILHAEKVRELAEIGPFDVTEGLQRFNRGDCCYTARVDGNLIHYSWVQRSGQHPITDAGLSVPTGSGEFWIYHCATVKWARGRGIYPAALRRILDDHFEA